MTKMDELLKWARKGGRRPPAAVEGGAAPQSEQIDPRTEAEAKGEIPKETGGPKGLEPTRYGDWEKAGRCFDF